jgi:hypothetical protein
VRQCCVPKIEIAADGNRSGDIRFDGPADRRCLFWTNTDCGIERENEGMWQKDDLDIVAYDCNDGRIGNRGTPGQGACKRDLEDFARLHVNNENGFWDSVMNKCGFQRSATGGQQ